MRLLRSPSILLGTLAKEPLVILNTLNVFKYGRQALSLFLAYRVIPYLGKQPYVFIVILVLTV